MPYENKLIFFDLGEVLSLLRLHVETPEQVSNNLRIIRLTPLKQKHDGTLAEKRPQETGDTAAIEVTFSCSETFQSFWQVFRSELLIECMIARMIELKCPIARQFSKRVLVSDFHICLEIGNMPVQRDDAASFGAFELMDC